MNYMVIESKLKNLTHSIAHDGFLGIISTAQS